MFIVINHWYQIENTSDLLDFIAHTLEETQSEVEQDLDFAIEKLTNIHPFFLDKEELINYQKKVSTIKSSVLQNE